MSSHLFELYPEIWRQSAFFEIQVQRNRTKVAPSELIGDTNIPLDDEKIKGYCSRLKKAAREWDAEDAEEQIEAMTYTIWNILASYQLIPDYNYLLDP
jgi:hypothetical protein